MRNNGASRFVLAAGAVAVAVVAIIAAGGMALALKGDRPAPGPGQGVTQAVADLEPTRGHQALGQVVFKNEGHGVRVTARLQGLPPGPHGFHIHEKGDCSAPDASSAGEHFNPTGMPHGAPEAEQRHLGDLGNVVADASRTAQLDRVDHHLTLDGPNSIVGRAVVVHAHRDDLTTQPSGDAGDRIACGVIRSAGSLGR